MDSITLGTVVMFMIFELMGCLWVLVDLHHHLITHPLRNSDLEQQALICIPATLSNHQIIFIPVPCYQQALSGFRAAFISCASKQGNCLPLHGVVNSRRNWQKMVVSNIYLILAVRDLTAVMNCASIRSPIS